MSKNAKIVLVLLLLCVVIAVVPMIFLGGTAEFGGADGEAEAAITEIDQDYEPVSYTHLLGKYAVTEDFRNNFKTSCFNGFWFNDGNFVHFIHATSVDSV